MVSANVVFLRINNLYVFKKKNPQGLSNNYGNRTSLLFVFVSVCDKLLVQRGSSGVIGFCGGLLIPGFVRAHSLTTAAATTH